MSTALHQRIVAADYGDQERTDLMIKVWAGTPFVVNVRTGNINSETEREITEWCRERFGRDAWPIHGKPGKWQRGSATVHGETFMGFDTAETVAIFMGRFGHLVIEDEAPAPQANVGSSQLKDQTCYCHSEICQRNAIAQQERAQCVDLRKLFDRILGGTVRSICFSYGPPDQSHNIIRQFNFVANIESDTVVDHLTDTDVGVVISTDNEAYAVIAHLTHGDDVLCHLRDLYPLALTATSASANADVKAAAQANEANTSPKPPIFSPSPAPQRDFIPPHAFVPTAGDGCALCGRGPNYTAHQRAPVRQAEARSDG